MTVGVYELRLKDHTGGVVARFAGRGRPSDVGGGLQAFEYEKVLNDIGNSVVHIFGDDERINQHLRLKLPQEAGSSFLDYQWEFARQDIRFQDAFEVDFETFHRADSPETQPGGLSTYTSWGESYNTLVFSEAIRYSSGSAQANKNADVSVVVREFIEENIGINAGNDGNGNSRVRPGLTVATIPNIGKNWRGGRSNKLLGDVIQELSEFAPGDFYITSAGPGLFSFEFKVPRYGADRTRNNTQGNQPVVFSADLGTVEFLQTIVDYTNSINAVYVLGQGPGELRVVRTRTNQNALAMSPWARRAVARDRRDAVQNAVLDDTGDAILEDGRARREMSFAIKNTGSAIYKRDWDLGDLVTVEDSGFEFDVKIRKVKVALTPGGDEIITPTFVSEVVQ